MKSGGRRSPLGPLLGGLVCCVLMVAALGIGLGVASSRSPADTAKVTTLSHAAVTAHLVARPSLPDQHASPAVAVVLMVVFGFVLIRRRPAVAVDLSHGRRPTGRAPPGPFSRT